LRDDRLDHAVVCVCLLCVFSFDANDDIRSFDFVDPTVGVGDSQKSCRRQKDAAGGMTSEYPLLGSD